jgi:hypothetical protein
MKNKLTLLAFLLATFTVKSQTWQWANNASAAKSDIGKSVCTDAVGNVYVIGTFSASAITIGTTTLTNMDGSSSPYGDVFVAKYDPLGNVLWATSAGGTGDENGKSITVDASGNIYVTGSFKSYTMTIGSTSLINNNTTSMFSARDIFVIKYDPSGNALWARKAGGATVDDDEGEDIAVDVGGNVYVTGYFSSSTATFGGITLNNNGSYGNSFIAKYTSSGNVSWARTTSGTPNARDIGHSVCTDASGNVFVTGEFAGSTISFGSTSLTNTNTSGSAFYIVKYNSSGNILWAKSASGGVTYGDDRGYGVNTDAGGNVYATGFFQGSSTITFGSQTLTNVAPSYKDIFLVKYDPLGSVLWAKSAGGTSDDKGLNIDVDAGGNIYLIGTYVSPTITVGSYTFSNHGGYSDILVATYDAAGNVLWSSSMGGTASDDGYDIATIAGGGFAITGSFSSATIQFGNTTLSNSGVTGTLSDMFCAKYGPTMNIAQTSTYEMKIYPNPVRDVINLQLSTSENIIIRIEDIQGCTLLELKDQHSKDIRIDLSGYPAGLYVVSIINNTGLMRKRVIKE